MGEQKRSSVCHGVFFQEFTTQAEKKIETVMVEPPERSLSKSLQRGEDPAFDQLLIALSSVSEHCLPSILRTRFAWYDRQAIAWLGSPLVSGSISSATSNSITSSIDSLEKDQISLEPNVAERRDMAVEFIFCIVLVEVLKQLPFHPGHHDLVAKIEDLAFLDTRELAVLFLGHCDHMAIKDVFEEFASILREACDRKQENVRRKKRKDNLRLQILKILEMMAEEKNLLVIFLVQLLYVILHVAMEVMFG